MPKFQLKEEWVPGLALAAVVVLAVCAVAIGIEENTFFRTDASGQAIALALPGDVTRPGLAMELAATGQDAQRILDAGTVPGPAGDAARVQNRQAMRWMQYWDFPFIAAYVMLYWIIARRAGILPFKPLLVVAYLAKFTAILAGVMDVLEDIAILQAVHGGQLGSFSIRDFGIWKWKLVFATAFLESSVFLAWSELPLVGRILSLLVGVAFIGVPVLGIQSALLNCDSFLELDATWLSGGFLILAVFSVWRFVTRRRAAANVS
jgi:hypothetical protein